MSYGSLFPPYPNKQGEGLAGAAKLVLEEILDGREAAATDQVI